VSEGPLASFCLFAALHMFVSSWISLNTFGLKNISNISMKELFWFILKFLFIPATLKDAGL
jgi:hypothetical protein